MRVLLFLGLFIVLDMNSYAQCTSGCDRINPEGPLNWISTSTNETICITEDKGYNVISTGANSTVNICNVDVTVFYFITSPGTVVNIYGVDGTLIIGNFISGAGSTVFNTDDCSNSDKLIIEGSSVDPSTYGCIPLPVELAFFSGKQQSYGVDLQWRTISELNNYCFLVQRSDDLSEWLTLYKVLGNGNSSMIQNYSYTDNYPKLGANYYRLV